VSVEIHPLFGSDSAPPGGARDLELDEIGVDEAMRLNSLWHSILPDTVKSNILRNKRRVCYCMHYGGKYYACAIWTDPVAANRLSFEALELRRMAIDSDAPRNTATRMLGLMRRDIKKRWPELRKVISYQSVDHHYGTIYKADNWVPAGGAKFTDWATKKQGHAVRKRAAPQIKSAKVRWERNL